MECKRSDVAHCVLRTPYSVLCTFSPSPSPLPPPRAAWLPSPLAPLLSPHLFLPLLLLAAAAGAQQLDVLKKMPADLLRSTGGARPDAEGMVGYNRGGFKSPEFQCPAMRAMLRAAVREDRQGIDDGWRAIDATFRQQSDDGGFSRQGAPHGGPSAAAIWLAEVDQAILVLRESPLGPKYRARIDALIPKIAKAARWLAKPHHQERLKGDDADAPNRLLFDALAYGLSGVLSGDGRLKLSGGTFLGLAMAQYRSADGVFLENHGADSSYQAVAALNLQVWLLYFPDKTREAAANAAVRWELGRIRADGWVDVAGNTRTGLGQERWMGHPKQVDLSAITFCLLYDFARMGRRESLEAARRIVQRRK